MSTGKIIQIIVILLVLYVGWFVALPFVNKYRLEKAVENIAQYCTINSVERSEKEFQNRIVDLGRTDIQPGSLLLDKDEDTSKVKATLKYKDRIKVFGHVFKELEFTIVKEAAKVDKII
ncbi:MAG: hypothetical protein ACOX2F_11585 [bacterium]